ncbi:MAG: DUF1257 domain-containing protein [Planctomycetales bacterium]|nr:DUF1257 domain-containing protein [Planctomycetales bacterium]
MSHIVTIATQIRDPVAVVAACRRLQLPPPAEGRHRLFAEQVDGLAVRLRDWRYPVVAQLATGELRYDNFQGRWGDAQRLDELLQAYAVEKATLEARRRGQAVTEQQLADGSVRLTLHAGGASS